MQVTIEKVFRQEKMPPREGENGPGSIAWRLVCKADDGTEQCVWVRSEDSDRGRVYAEGQTWDVTFDGREYEDRDKSKWKKARFDKPGSQQGGRRGGGGGSHQSGGGQQQRPAGAGGADRGPREEIARDVYAEKNFRLFFANLAIGRGLRQALEDPCSDAMLEEHASKMTNMMFMDWNVHASRLTAAKMNETVEAERARKEAEEAKRQADAEEKRQREEQAKLRQQSTGETLDI